MTARQKEIQAVQVAVETCKKIVAHEGKNYAQALVEVEDGIRDVDSPTIAFLREQLAWAKKWLADEEARLAVLEAQEASK